MSQDLFEKAVELFQTVFFNNVPLDALEVLLFSVRCFLNRLVPRQLLGQPEGVGRRVEDLAQQ